MKHLNVLVTACGCPGASTLIRMLQRAADYDNRKIRIIGMDCDDEAIGKFLCDGFYQVPRVEKIDEYLDALMSIILAENIDVVFPESSLEMPKMAYYCNDLEALGCRVLVSDYKAVIKASNKYLCYQAAQSVGANLPLWGSPKDVQAFRELVYEFGYPDKPVCFKPHYGKGSRGFRIIDPRANRLDQLMHKKPNSKYITLNEALGIFEDNGLPDLLVMEFVQGMEYTADCLCMNGKALLTQIKSNEQVRWGVTVRGELVNKPDILEQVQLILSVIPLSYNVNLQFIDGKLIEINPRVSTFIYQDDLVPPYLAIKLALGELTENQVMEYQDKIQTGRRFIRYMDQVFV